MAQKSLDQKSGGNRIPPTSDEGKFRGYSMTIWNDETLEKVKNSKPRYMCWAPETCPDTGKFHYQTYVYYKSERHVSAIGKLVAGGNGWCAPAMGTAQANRAYIFGPYINIEKHKEKPANPDAKEFGEIPEQGKRNDIAGLAKAIREGKKRRELDDWIDVRAKYPKFEATILKEDLYDKNLENIRNGILPEVHVRWGEPGTGKSRFVFDTYSPESIYAITFGDGCASSVWFDDYTGQDIILLDEFDGEIPWRFFLNLLDRYWKRAQCKGGFTYIIAKKFYITSNSPPHEWYPKYRDKYYALERRLTSVTKITAPSAPAIIAPDPQ